MELRQKMADMGYFGIRMPEEFGGLGLGVFEYALIAEELARGWMSVASIIARAGSMMGVGGWPLEKRQELTRKAAQGEWLSAVALSEPNVGSDLRAVACKAVLDGDEWVITGNKYWCTFADGADYINLLARFDGPDAEAAGFKGTGQFIIEKARGELPEGCQGAPIPKIGYFGWRTWELAFDGCRIPKENLITGGEGGGEGFKNAVNWLNAARVHTAARSIGLARGAWRTPWPTPASGSSSACPSPTSRKPASSWPGWRARSKPPVSSCTTQRPSWTAATGQTRRLPWPNGTRRKWPNG